MPLTLDQYAAYLDTRGLTWPTPPPVESPRVKAHLPRVSGVRAVLWNVYGTLLSISDGELKFETDNALLMTVALDKTIHEFKMWGSMSRKPGQPAEYMREIYKKVLTEQRLAPTQGEKFPEVLSERVWEAIVKKLFQKEYQFDATFYGPLPEYARKVAYFFHASLQGTGCCAGAAAAIKELAGKGMVQGLLADGQCFTGVQVARGLSKQDGGATMDTWIPPASRFLSFAVKARKPSDAAFAAALDSMAAVGVEPAQILHVGSSLTRDIGPAKTWGMKTALFAGDRSSLSATSDQLKDAAYRPDALLTALEQVRQLFA